METQNFKVGQTITTWWGSEVTIIKIDENPWNKPLVVKTKEGKKEYYHYNQIQKP